MGRTLAVLCFAAVVVTALPAPGYTWGDKFLVPGRGTSLASLHRPPKALEILIYGNQTSPAVAAVSAKDFRETLETIGHKVTRCDDPASCSKALSSGQFHAVLADPSDAARLKSEKQAASPAIVPVMYKVSKGDLAAAKSEYGQAFDASRGSLRLLPVLNSAAKGSR